MEPHGTTDAEAALKHLPSYREGGEESFRLAELVRNLPRGRIPALERATINLFPPFTPDALFRWSGGWSGSSRRPHDSTGSCSSHVLGFAAER